MADGCITTRKSSPYLSLRITESDVEHVKKLRSFLESNHKIGIYSNNRGFKTTNKLACLSISSYKLATSLALFGVVPRKSLTVPLIHMKDCYDCE